MSEAMTERPFSLQRGGGQVPGILWTRQGTGTPAPLVLLGHGGSGHKRSPRIVDIAHRLVSHGDLAVLAIDGPYHGDRVESSLTAEDYQARMLVEGIEVVTERMVGDWCAAVSFAQQQSHIDTSNIAFLGMSMAVRFGLPLAARLGDRLACAVFGKFGLEQSASLPSDLLMVSRLQRDAASITAPTLLHVQWDDEVFPRSGQLALFDALGSPDKRMVAFPGHHGDTPAHAVDTWCEFVTAQVCRTPHVRSST